MCFDFDHKLTCTLQHSLSHTSMIDVMMSAFASPASVVCGPLPIHLDTLLRAAQRHHCRTDRESPPPRRWLVEYGEEEERIMRRVSEQDPSVSG